MKIRRKIDLSSETFEKVEKYLETITVEPIPNEPLNFVVEFETDLSQYGLKVIDLLAYLLWFLEQL